MFRRTSFLCILVTVLFFGCNETSMEPIQDHDDVVNHTGAVQQLGTEIFIIIDDVAESRHYAPTNLPNEFKQHGLRVLFSGHTREIPPNVRMAGIPLDLSSIREDIR